MFPFETSFTVHLLLKACSPGLDQNVPNGTDEEILPEIGTRKPSTLNPEPEIPKPKTIINNVTLNAYTTHPLEPNGFQ